MVLITMEMGRSMKTANVFLMRPQAPAEVPLAVPLAPGHVIDSVNSDATTS